ncbi:MAG: hypothetical protein ABEJ06_04615 [Haloarculaceae archaeon]
MTRAQTDAASVSSHDVVLALLPAPLLAAVAVGWLYAVGMATAVALGSLPSVAVIGYALFLDPPA